MSDSEDKRPLSREETADVLGSEPPEEVEPLSLDPLGLKAIATRVGDRLISRGGRPTDASWDDRHKVPMSRETWEELRRIAKALNGRGLRVAPGQLAGMALEAGLSSLDRERAVIPRRRIHASHRFSERVRREGEKLSRVMAREDLWSCAS